jgi:hypothetical protein
MARPSTGDRRRTIHWSTLFSGAAVLGVIISAAFFPSAGAQTNGARLGIGPDIPTTTTVGAKDVPLYISLTNLSDPADGTITIPQNGITFTPACGSLPNGAVPPCPTPDPGVFAVTATGTGRAGTNCAGATYSIVQDSAATGEVTFNGPAITLAASNATTLVGGSCVIDFSVNVLKAPTIDADPATPGIQTYQLVNASGWHTQQNNTASCCGSSHTTVAPATPALSTKASPGITLGGSFTDTATLSGGSSPTGSITFTFFGPGNTTCAAPPVFTSPPVTVNGAGPYTSAPFTPTATGTYLTIATYSGDHNNAGIATKCMDTGESVIVTPVAVARSPVPTPKPSVLGPRSAASRRCRSPGPTCRSSRWRCSGRASSSPAWA